MSSPVRLASLIDRVQSSALLTAGGVRARDIYRYSREVAARPHGGARLAVVRRARSVVT